MRFTGTMPAAYAHANVPRLRIGPLVDRFLTLAREQIADHVHHLPSRFDFYERTYLDEFEFQILFTGPRSRKYSGRNGPAN